jgi:hypothetical protein
MLNVEIKKKQLKKDIKNTTQPGLTYQTATQVMRLR